MNYVWTLLFLAVGFANGYHSGTQDARKQIKQRAYSAWEGWRVRAWTNDRLDIKLWEIDDIIKPPKKRKWKK